MRTPDVLDGHGIRLRPWRVEDAASVESIRLDPVVSRWSALPAEDAAEWIARQNRRSDGLSVAVTEPPRDMALGKVALGHYKPEIGQAELSFWLIPAARGRGLAVAACRTLCEWGFCSVGLSSVLLDIEVDNDASQTVARSLGAFSVPSPPHIEIDRTGTPRRLTTYLLTPDRILGDAAFA